MPDKKISALTAATTPLAGTEVLPIVQSGTTKKVATDYLTVKNIRSSATTGILQMAGVTAGSTRTMTVPDANFSVVDCTSGTWTPTLTRDTTFTCVYSTQVGLWNRVGNLVTITCNIGISSISAAGSGLWYLNGLPFAANSTSSYRASGSVGFSDIFSASCIYTTASSAVAVITLNGALITSAATPGSIFCTMTYQV